MKKKGKDEAFFKPEEIVEENEKTKKSLKELEKVTIICFDSNLDSWRGPKGWDEKNWAEQGFSWVN